MIKNIIKRIFDIREGELNISVLMLIYILLIIATLLIIKPAVNSLFISQLGADSLPFGYLLVAISAVISSYFYTRATERFSLHHIIRLTLFFSVLALILLGILLHFQTLQGWVLYCFYVGVAIYAVLATSQFWVLANLVFNVREAKRLFGFVGAGAITGGIFGGYLTTILAPVIGNENLVFIAAFFLILCFPILSYIHNRKIGELNIFIQKKRLQSESGHPFQLIRNSRHLTYLAVIIGIGVITARLVDYQFSDFAVKKIADSDELTSFFGFWLSSFNLISLIIQLFLTRRIVGVWGVGVSLLLLPAGIFLGSILFLIFPELWVVILLKAIDGSLKQSIHKSAIELLALPLPFQLKHKTKSFIDVVVDSIATGIAGCVLIFFVKGLEVPDGYIAALIMALALIWTYFVWKVREEYFITFRKNLDNLATTTNKKPKKLSKANFLQGMKNVFKQGTEREILFMLSKTREINDKRFTKTIIGLLKHPSTSVKTEALRNLYFLNDRSAVKEVRDLLESNDDDLVLAALEYLLLNADKNDAVIFDTYLDHPNDFISGAALICLAKEVRGNADLKHKYQMTKRVEDKAMQISTLPPGARERELSELISIIGFANHKEGYQYLAEGLTNPDQKVVKTSIKSAGHTLSPIFIDKLLELLENKIYRQEVTAALVNYGEAMITILKNKIFNKEVSLPVSRMLPQVISKFNVQESVRTLFSILVHAQDLTVRLECIRALTDLKHNATTLYFDKNQVAKVILEECKLYDQTLNAMHTQVIIYYLKRKKAKQPVSEKEMEARGSLMDLLEQRLDAGLERIFKLLELQYARSDVQMAYHGILSPEQEKRTHAVEFLDNMLNPKLKNIFIPIIESTILDTSSEEVIEMISKSRLTEYRCFENILKGKDLKLKLAVLYLIQQQADPKYLPLAESLLDSEDLKIRTFAKNSQEAIHEGMLSLGG